MNAALHFGQGPLGGGAGSPEQGAAAAPAPDATPTWVRDPLEPPLAGLGQSPGS